MPIIWPYLEIHTYVSTESGKHGRKKPLLCVRFCNKDHVLRQNCRKKVSSLWMGRIYCQDSGGDPLICHMCERPIDQDYYIVLQFVDNAEYNETITEHYCSDFCIREVWKQ